MRTLRPGSAATMIQEGSNAPHSPLPLAGEAARSAGEGRSELGVALRMPSPQPSPASGRGGTARVELRPAAALAWLAGVVAVQACTVLPQRLFDLALAVA